MIDMEASAGGFSKTMLVLACAFFQFLFAFYTVHVDCRPTNVLDDAIEIGKGGDSLSLAYYGIL